MNAEDLKPEDTKRQDDHGQAVLDGKLRHLSVSQLTKFDPTQHGGCERKWWYDKVAKLPTPTGKAQRHGHEVHSQIEHYLKTGEDVLGPVARAGKVFIPAPGDGLLIEHPLWPKGAAKSLLDAAGVPLVGFIDLVDTRDQWIDTQGELKARDAPLEVIDWKTTGTIAAYAKAGSELIDTIQMLGYAKAMNGGRVVRLSHVYFQTRGPKLAEKRTALAQPDDVARKWERVEGVARRMLDVAKESDATKVEPNLESCTAYGGCPYLMTCPKKGTTQGVEMSLLSKLRAGAVNAVSAEVKAEVEALKAEEAAVLPPDAPKSNPATAAMPVPAEVLPTLPPAVQEVAKAHAAIAEPAAPKRGRPKKVAEEITVNTGMSSEVAPGLYFFVDAVPQQVSFTVQSLDPYIDGACKILADKYGAADVRCASGDSPLGFGKWKGALAAHVRETPPPAGYYCTLHVRGNELKETVIEALRPLSTLFVRGV